MTGRGETELEGQNIIALLYFYFFKNWEENMNRVYKIVWSKAKNAYVVTSELAKNHTKSASGKAVKAALTAAVGMGVLMGGYVADAAPATNPSGDGPGIAIGTGSSSQKVDSTAVGKNAKTTGEHALAVGYNNMAGADGAISRVALAKEVEDLKAIVKAQSAEIKAMRGAMQSGASVMKDVNFPDVPKDHWAYSYVKSLADRGLLEGYPDGEFKGDRSMTRYEFAAIIYRALQNGAPIDSDMAKAIGEFDPEINRIKDLDRTRVDRISGKDNDRHKVERVRVNNESNKEKGDYRDVYGSHISPEA